MVFAEVSWAKTRLRIATMLCPDHLIIRDTVQKVYRSVGMDVEFLVFPGRRALIESSKGHVDAELSRIYEIGLEYKSLARVPTPIFQFAATVFSKNKNLKITNWQVLKPLRIGIMSGMRFSENNVAGFPDVTVVETPERLFRLLEADRVDVVIFSRVNGLCMINELGLAAKIFALNPPLENIDAYHYVHENHRHLIPLLDEAVKEIMKKERLETKIQHFLENSCRM
ncbi:MAG: substrate-binding periplasmic protein [Oligoflexus sp.]